MIKTKRKAAKPSDIDQALYLADSIIRENWPALYVAMNLHRLGPGPEDRMDFARYPAQVDFLKDDSQKMTIMKCVQVGITECLLVKCFAKAIIDGWNIIYSWPTEQLRNDMVKKRVNRSIACTPFYRQAIKESASDSDDIGMKLMGRGAIRNVASQSKVAFLSDAADMIVIDEKDKSDLDNLELAPDRLQASPHKFDWRVGNPSYPKFGIHDDYLESDQKEWHIACPACNEIQPLDFFANVVRQKSENEYELIDRRWARGKRDIDLYCRKCAAPLNRFSPGLWIPGNPGAQISGYHFNQLFSPTVLISEIWESFVKAQSDSTKLQIFYNSRLGLPYSAIGQSLSAALLQSKCAHDYLMPSTANSTTMGVDVGSKLPVRISDYPEPGIRRAVFIGSVNSFEEIDTLIAKYGVKVGVIDSRPEFRKASELRDRHPRVIYLCDYLTERSMDFWKVDQSEYTVKVQRTASIDDAVAEILKGNNHIPKDFRSLDNGDYVRHMEAPKRRTEGEGAAMRYVWDEEGKPDHHFHADNYDNLARKILAEFGIQTDIRSAGGRELKSELDIDRGAMRRNLNGFTS